MIKDLINCFEDEQQYYLDKIEYSRIEDGLQLNQHKLLCNDNITVNVNGEYVEVKIKRTLTFEPEALFYLSVSFGSILKINDSSKGKYEWTELNLAEEFKENGQFVLDHLLARISLLIAQITSSFGQQPLILPPQIGGQ